MPGTWLLLVLVFVLLGGVDGFGIQQGRFSLKTRNKVSSKHGGLILRGRDPVRATSFHLAALRAGEVLSQQHNGTLPSFLKSKRPAMIASTLLASIVSLNTFPAGLQAAYPSFSTLAVVAANSAPSQAFTTQSSNPSLPSLDSLINRIQRLEFRMDESDRLRKQEAAEEERNASKRQENRYDLVVSCSLMQDAASCCLTYRQAGAQKAPRPRRPSAESKAGRRKREISVGYDSKMAAMEIARKEGEDRNFLVSEISNVAAIVSAYASVAFSKKDQNSP